MTPRTLLVLGASAHQLFTIQTAQSMGFRVVTTDNILTNPGHNIADVSYNIDTTNKSAILDIAKSENISGVVSPCTDIAVNTAAYLAEKLNFPGPNIHATKTTTDKEKFRVFQKQYNFTYPEFHIAESTSICRTINIDHEHKWIIKPNRSSGSKGVFIVASNEELKSRLIESKPFSTDNKVIVEQLIEGHHSTIEGIVQNGEIVESFFMDRKTASQPYTSTIGHYIPSELTATDKKQVIDQINRIWNLLDVKNCVFDCDFIWTNHGVYILEISPRLGGNSISELINRAYGFNLAEIAIKFALGLKVDLPSISIKAPMAVLLLGVWQSGNLRIHDNDLVKVKKYSWLESIKIDIPNGARVEPFINGRNVIGTAFITASSMKELSKYDSKLRNELNAQVYNDS